ncbi:MAG TPA: ATP synthase subunit I [Nitrospirota bacterium]|nr:ATP synthase subunit I [Nitrospirota bacterium]
MSEETADRQRAVTAIVKAVMIKTAIIEIVAAAAAAAYGFAKPASGPWWFVPVGILFGGALGALNFRWLAVSVERFYLRRGATPGVSNLVAFVISGIKLTLIFVVLFIVIKWQLVHVFGLVIGLSLCFLAILWEGARIMTHTLKNEGK